MDRRLKERLIGATVLVVLIVLIVPELLSGPKSAALERPHSALPEVAATETVRHVTVDLATRKAVAAAEPAAAASAAGADRETAPPADLPSESASAERSTSAPGPASAQPPGSAEPPAAEVPDAPAEAGSAKTVTTRHAWAVQVGSFASKPNAQKLVRHLRLQFTAVTLSASGTGHALRYRVRLGPLADRNAALRALGKVKAQGYHASLVAPAA